MGGCGDPARNLVRQGLLAIEIERGVGLGSLAIGRAEESFNLLISKLALLGMHQPEETTVFFDGDPKRSCA
jgi:hypothetical protein